MEGIESLADTYDSVDEILAASQEELTADNGIGDRRTTKILHRHSSKPQDRIRETSGKRTIAAVEDDEGVLRLPEELEDETE